MFYGTDINEPIYVIDATQNPNKTYYLLKNDQNSVMAVYDSADTSFDAKEHYEYSAYGLTVLLNENNQPKSYIFNNYFIKPFTYKIKSDFANPFGFQGMWRDEHTGLYHTHYRIYNPQFARWLNPDPAGYQDGMNLYRFYGGPNGVDPLGLLLGTIVDSITLAIFNGGYDLFTINGLLSGRNSNETIDPYHWLDNQEFKESYYTSRIGVESLITIGTFGISTATKAAGWVYRGKQAYTIWDTAGNISSASKGIMDINQNGLNWSNGTQTVGGALGFGFNVYGAVKGVDKAYLFRGTTDGYLGNPALQKLKITPTSTDPLVATLFAIEASQYGKGVVLIGARSKFPTIPGNVLAKLEAEIGVRVAPIIFASQSRSISVETSRLVLQKLGFELPKSINGKIGLDNILKSSPRLNPQQINQYIKEINKK